MPTSPFCSKPKLILCQPFSCPLQRARDGEPILGAGEPGRHSLGLSTAHPTPPLPPPAIDQDPLRQESTWQVSSGKTPDLGKSQAPLPEVMTFWKAERICILTSFQMILTWRGLYSLKLLGQVMSQGLPPSTDGHECLPSTIRVCGPATFQDVPLLHVASPASCGPLVSAPLVPSMIYGYDSHTLCEQENPAHCSQIKSSPPLLPGNGPI